MHPRDFRHAPCLGLSRLLPLRFHPDPFDPSDCSAGGCGPTRERGRPGQPGGRLNLLLSACDWQPTPWADQLPPLLGPMGIQSYRVVNGRQASRLIENTRIHIAVVDLALPLDDASCPSQAVEEGGVRILDLLRRLDEPPPTLVIKRGRTQRDDARELNAALRAGAFAVLDRPREVSDLNLLLEAMRRVLGRFYAGRWPDIV